MSILFKKLLFGVLLLYLSTTQVFGVGLDVNVDGEEPPKNRTRWMLKIQAASYSELEKIEKRCHEFIDNPINSEKAKRKRVRRLQIVVDRLQELAHTQAFGVVSDVNVDGEEPPKNRTRWMLKIQAASYWELEKIRKRYQEFVDNPINNEKVNRRRAKRLQIVVDRLQELAPLGVLNVKENTSPIEKTKENSAIPEENGEKSSDSAPFGDLDLRKSSKASEFRESEGFSGIVKKYRPAMEFLHHVITDHISNPVFIEHDIDKDGDCGFHGLGLSREEAGRQLIEEIERQGAIIHLLLLPDLLEAFRGGDWPQSLRNDQEYQRLRKNYPVGEGTVDNEDLRNYLLQPQIQKAFIADYISGGGWMTYVRGQTGMLDALAQINNLQVNVWVPNEEDRGKLDLVHRANHESNQVVHLIHRDGLTHFNFLEIKEQREINNSDSVNLWTLEDFGKPKSPEGPKSLSFSKFFSGTAKKNLYSSTSKKKKIGWKNLEEANEEQLNDLQSECLAKLAQLKGEPKKRKRWENRFQLIHGQLVLLGKIPPYHLKNILVKTKNPNFLNLHGIASASAAEKRVMEFIRAAKTMHKRSVVVITGKGIHLNHRGQRGTLFKSLPSWIGLCESVKSFTKLYNMAGYRIFLKPSLKLKKINKYRPIKHEEEKSFIDEVTRPEPAVEGDLRAHQLRREFVRLKHREKFKGIQNYIKVNLQDMRRELSTHRINFDPDDKEEVFEEDDVF